MKGTAGPQGSAVAFAEPVIETRPVRRRQTAWIAALVAGSAMLLMACGTARISGGVGGQVIDADTKAPVTGAAVQLKRQASCAAPRIPTVVSSPPSMPEATGMADFASGPASPTRGIASRGAGRIRSESSRPDISTRRSPTTVSWRPQAAWTLTATSKSFARDR
jgi:hypothetical protein